MGPECSEARFLQQQYCKAVELPAGKQYAEAGTPTPVIPRGMKWSRVWDIKLLNFKLIKGAVRKDEHTTQE